MGKWAINLFDIAKVKPNAILRSIVNNTVFYVLLLIFSLMFLSLRTIL